TEAEIQTLTDSFVKKTEELFAIKETEERRIGLSKQAKAESEHAKVGIRNARKDANNEIKKVDVSDDMKKNTEAEIQTLTDSFVKKTEELFAIKETEIMTI
ncbi:MAG: ribosome-recycling factor, partial [Polaribacter sp.]|nr:ribosome-recycling factor [Polaribacter sp.]